MQIFYSTLSQMAFLFTFIVLGFIIAKFKLIPANSAAVLAKLENYVFIPALVLTTFMNGFTKEKITYAWKLLLFSSALVIVTAVLAVILARVCNKDAFIRKIYTYGLAFPNFGYMGNAVVMAVFPKYFVDYLIFTLPFWTLIYLWGVPVLLIPENSDGNKSAIASRLKSFVNPMFVCMLIGIFLGLSGIGGKIPAWLSSVAETAGDCMSPIAMLLTGITVSSINLKKTFTNLNIYLVSLIRLIALPIAFIAVAKFLPLSDVMYLCAVCAISMPLGLNTIVIPSAYGMDSSYAAGMAIISHLLSCVTIPIIFMIK